MKNYILFSITIVIVFLTSCRSYNFTKISYSEDKISPKIKPMVAKNNLADHLELSFALMYNHEINKNICQIRNEDTSRLDKENIGVADLKVVKKANRKGLIRYLICTAFAAPFGIPALVGLPVGHSKGLVKLQVDVKDKTGSIIKSYKATGRHTSYITCYWGYKKKDAENKSIDRAFYKALKKIKSKMEDDADFLNSKLPEGLLSENELASRKYIKDGDEQYTSKKYAAAIESYLKAYNIINPSEKKHAKLAYKLGSSYIDNGDESSIGEGIKYLNRSLELDPKVDYMAPVGLYLGYKSQGDYTNALKYLNYTLDNFSLNDKQITLLKEWRTKLMEEERQIMAGQELKKTPENVTINNLGADINGKDGDYFPSITADETTLLFTSRRNGSTGGMDNDGKHDEDIWISSKKADGSWESPRNFGSPVNSKNNNGVASFTGDGQYVVCVRCNENDGYGSCDLYGTTLIGNTWGVPKNLGSKLNSKEWDSQVSISADGKTLVWSSLRAGGYGEEDLWISRKNSNDEWSEPKNLGSLINTKGSELSPFLHPDGKTLYFSSDNLSPRIGGFDLYKTVLNDNGTWSKPVNLGYPINSEKNDKYFILSPSGIKGYFSSDRSGGYGSMDLYEIVYPQEKKSSLITFIGNVIDEETKVPLEATIKIEDLDSARLVGEYISNSITGKFVVILTPGHNYSLTVIRNGYLFYSENFNISVSNEFKEIKKEVPLQPIKEGKKIILNNIFFQTGKSELTESSVLEIDKLYTLLTQNSEIKVEISGHTDNTGSKVDNNKLSLDRATVVVNALINKGIKSSRLSAKGYGDSQPIAPNDTDENRQLNRRTEFKILTAN
ncbi:MAG: OmpA family protein [Bacteroidota bacterium]